MMQLVDNIVRNLKVAKVFRENTEKVNSFDFSPDGYCLVSSSADDQVIIYDCIRGVVASIVNTKKYGVDIIRFAHTKTTIIHSSTKVDNTIRYLSLYDNKYIRYFTGHTKKVVSLSKSPIDDLFASGSLDKSLRLWDLRSPICQGFITTIGRPVTAFDPEGLVLAAGINSETLKLFDIRSFDKGPFVTIKLPQDKDCDWTDLKFSGDGSSILITTNGSLHRLVNAFNGAPVQTFTGYLNIRRVPIEASFSPDSKYIFGGSSNGQIHVWNSNTGYKICELLGDHPGSVNCVKFNPRYLMLATACTNMGFWLPGENDDNNLLPLNF